MSTSSLLAAIGLGGVGVLYLFATFAAGAFLPKNTTSRNRWIFIWMIFDFLIHTIYEGSFVYYSTFGRTVNTSTGFIADIWKEYALADARWGTADPTTVAIEIITVIGPGPICLYILYLMARDDPMKYFWTIVLCTAEVYGNWMTFAPEWLTGCPSLDTSSFLNFWVFLFFANFIWVVVPCWLTYDAFVNISKAFSSAQKSKKRA